MRLMSLYERVSCHDRMRDRFRPDVPALDTSKRDAESMSDLARSLKSALACRDKDEIQRYMTALGQRLVAIKGVINSKKGRNAFDYEKSIMAPRRPLKTLQKARTSA